MSKTGMDRKTCRLVDRLIDGLTLVLGNAPPQTINCGIVTRDPRRT